MRYFFVIFFSASMIFFCSSIDSKCTFQLRINIICCCRSCLLFSVHIHSVRELRVTFNLVPSLKSDFLLCDNASFGWRFCVTVCFFVWLGLFVHLFCGLFVVFTLSAYLRLQCLALFGSFFFACSGSDSCRTAKYHEPQFIGRTILKKVSQRHSIFVSFGDHFCVSEVAQIDESTDFIILRVTQTGKHWNCLLNVVQINNKTENRKKIVVLFIMKLHYFIYLFVCFCCWALGWFSVLMHKINKLYENSSGKTECLKKIGRERWYCSLFIAARHNGYKN